MHEPLPYDPKPSAHLLQLMWSDEYRPVPTVLQSEQDAAPSAEKRPPEQGEHAPVPPAAANVPAEHCEQVPDAVLSVKLP